VKVPLRALNSWLQAASRRAMQLDPGGRPSQTARFARTSR